jgi:hypothetical protein
VTAIHCQSLHILEQLDLNNLTKSDLWTVCDYEAIPYHKFRRKNELLDSLNDYLENWSTNEKNFPSRHCWTLMVTNSRPLWKHKFIKRDYHANFEQFNRSTHSGKTHHHQAKANTSDYLNCGQYLQLKKQWLERDEFLYFLKLTRNLAKDLKIKATESDEYPAYPLKVLD